ncbi:MAG: hypothetical protein LBC47_04160 [Tannerella sp.]|jgi:hypothetical protein|nr:hypothetical protein [Tannerella sp.]
MYKIISGIITKVQTKGAFLGYVSAITNEGGFGIREASPYKVCGLVAFEGKEGKLEQDVYRDLKIRIKTQTNPHT